MQTTMFEAFEAHPGRPLKVLIGCEQSGVVRDAFNALGHDAWSCDLLAAETPSNRHIVGDVRDVMNWDSWDLLAVMHPPCTRLCNSGVRWLKEPPKNPPADCTREEAAAWPTLDRAARLEMIWRHLDRGAALFSDVWNVEHIPMVAVENPVMHPHAKARIRNFRPAAQSVQPWHFGTDEAGPDNERKRTCFWLRNLPKLRRTGTLDGTTARESVHKASPGADRWKERSRFFPGIAAAMADQWGGAAQLAVRAA
ncbi:hypothetical protein [Phaeobacter gallaeciensis]|uniref:hypothetical protein n=1 Tax=Phaeobacter gallaeciensis TaxID=60890 RepID=UPI00237EEB1A|nr:hypothetical protein [Phaeobacter gallaeciensis]MDE4189655.1 hypothetical protein [Phaeobacter gallaeciensis]MDE4198807.1 hypothetical protein [Phaeobacter gallaeciensis]MDE4202954.1 hypothetical protein [Phaeobacter gallaeciensis]MDE4207097.1 hypothetical protein [Phaeobacter gallaeciensis]MDE4215679.1 hypothetical protein [Phaeobacter gallaeciensis]